MLNRPDSYSGISLQFLLRPLRLSLFQFTHLRQCYVLAVISFWCSRIIILECSDVKPKTGLNLYQILAKITIMICILVMVH